MYEPFLEDLYQTLKNKYGVNIKYILSIDMVNHGKSFAFNEHKLGNDGTYTSIISTTS